jgi:hypothetical protein
MRGRRWLVALVCLSGCASIQSFRATPRTVCQDNPVTVAWDATGAVTIAAEPDVPGTGPKASTGSEQFRVSRNTRFSVTARRLLSTATTEADVAVAPPAREYGGVAACSPSDRVLGLSVPLGETQVGPSLRVATITNMNSRPLSIARGETRVTIPAGGSSTAFRGQPVAGLWTLRCDLASGESCEEALTSAASRLTFRVEFACGE